MELWPGHGAVTVIARWGQLLAKPSQSEAEAAAFVRDEIIITFMLTLTMDHTMKWNTMQAVALFIQFLI